MTQNNTAAKVLFVILRPGAYLQPAHHPGATGSDAAGMAGDQHRNRYVQCLSNIECTLRVEHFKSVARGASPGGQGRTAAVPGLVGACAATKKPAPGEGGLVRARGLGLGQRP